LFRGGGGVATESIVGKLGQYYDLAADVRYKNSHIPIRQLVQPDDPEVKEIAGILHQAPDFIDAACEFVNSFTTYGLEEGDYWRTPAESLAKAAAEEGIDCDDSAILLCSLLRNHIPPEKVYCAVGMWSVSGKREGHMFVLIEDEGGEDRILESTASPERPVQGKYELYAIFNDKYCFATKAGLELFDLKPLEPQLAGVEGSLDHIHW
jgi:hypothetical protein